jgi:hypothetical protein
VKKRFLILALVTASSASAIAGYRYTRQVTVTTQQAYGAIGSARNSGDTLQYIGCDFYATTTYSNLHCRARNSAGATLHCWQDARAYEHMAKVVASITDSSYVRFAVDPAAADPTRCTWVQVENHSKYEPPQP